MAYWTLVVFIVIGGESIVVDGFRNPDDCKFAGQINLEFVQVDHLGKPNPKVKYQCTKTGIPPVHCKPDTRTYGRTGECIL